MGEALVVFFEAVPQIRRILETLKDVGLDYIEAWGSPWPRPSRAGEAQAHQALDRARQARGTGKEPSTSWMSRPRAWHFEDIRSLLGVLGRLVDAGQHRAGSLSTNLDVIKTADWVIDMGPEGGGGGGRVLASRGLRKTSLK